VKRQSSRSVCRIGSQASPEGLKRRGAIIGGVPCSAFAPVLAVDVEEQIDAGLDRAPPAYRPRARKHARDFDQAFEFMSGALGHIC
jgi:hypothetical protein